MFFWYNTNTDGGGAFTLILACECRVLNERMRVEKTNRNNRRYEAPLRRLEGSRLIVRVRSFHGYTYKGKGEEDGVRSEGNAE